jgi:hypothetical protein
MAKQYTSIEPPLRKFIERQHVFFVASATADSRINISPKGLDALRVVDATTVIYLDLTGSGNETAAHLRADGRLTIMFCAFEGPAMILRLYGRGRSHLNGSDSYRHWLDTAFGGRTLAGARQIVEQNVDLVQTSCGYAVPAYAYTGERETLIDWAERQGEDRIRAYWADKNLSSIDGLPTGFDAMFRDHDDRS